MPLSAAAKKYAQQKYGPNWAFAKRSGVSAEEIRRRKVEAAAAVAEPAVESGGLAAYRDRTAAPSGIFVLPEVMILNILSNLEFLELIRLRGTTTRARAFIDAHLPQIYAEKRRQDSSLPEVEFLPRGAPDRDRRNLEMFQDQFDRNAKNFDFSITAHIARWTNPETWEIEDEMDYDGMDSIYYTGNLYNAVLVKLRKKHSGSFFERDGNEYHSLGNINITVDTNLNSLENATPVAFPDWIRNIEFVVGEWERHLISFDVTEEEQAQELAPIADKVEQAVKRLLRDQKRQNHQIQIKVAIASYGTLLMMKGWNAIAESHMTVREYRAKLQRQIAATNGHQRRQWERFLPNFDRMFANMVETHEGRLILNEDSTIYQLAYADRHDFEYLGGSPLYWHGASIVRKVRLA